MHSILECLKLIYGILCLSVNVSQGLQFLKNTFIVETLFNPKLCLPQQEYNIWSFSLIHFYSIFYKISLC